MKTLLPLLLLFAADALADCATPGLKLDGVVHVDGCDPATQACRPAAEVVADYLKRGDDTPAEYTVALMSSPWHLYDGEQRILLPAELAAMLRPELAKHPEKKRVRLIGSWTGTAAENDGTSLAAQVSAALDGFPVVGMDGFLWLTPKGGYRTTRQAFTTRSGGRYLVGRDQDVLMPLVDGELTVIADQIRARDTDGKSLLRLARGYDVFGLCRRDSLAAYEEAAKRNHPIAAYNAALIHLELGTADDRAAARQLLETARDHGDRKAAQRLAEMSAESAGK